MKRVTVNPNTLRISVNKIYNQIEKDIVNNPKEVVNRYEYYTRKYRGDLLNDVNVGIFLDNDSRMAIQIYVSNGITAMRTKLKLTSDLKRVSLIETTKLKTMILKTKVARYDNINNTTFEQRVSDAVSLLYGQLEEDTFEYAGRDFVKVGYPDEDGNVELEIHFV